MLTTHTIFNQSEAKKVAEKLNKTDDWDYKVINNPIENGPKTAIIEIYDENGEFVSLM